MEFRKPQVVIDLDEYQLLKEQAERNITSDYTLLENAAKAIVLFTVQENLAQVGDQFEKLKSVGILVTISFGGARNRQLKDIFIEITQKFKDYVASLPK